MDTQKSDYAQTEINLHDRNCPAFSGVGKCKCTGQQKRQRLLDEINDMGQMANLDLSKPH